VKDCLFSTDQVASKLGLSTSYLSKLRLTGDGPEYIKAGKRVLYRLEDIEGWICSKKRRSTSEDK